MWEIGYDDYQIYLLLSCAPIQGHIAGLVDVSLFLFLLLPLSPNPSCFTVLTYTIDPQRLHDPRPPNGHLRLRHLAQRPRAEDGHGLLRQVNRSSTGLILPSFSFPSPLPGSAVWRDSRWQFY